VATKFFCGDGPIEAGPGEVDWFHEVAECISGDCDLMGLVVFDEGVGGIIGVEYGLGEWFYERVEIGEASVGSAEAERPWSDGSGDCFVVFFGASETAEGFDAVLFTF